MDISGTYSDNSTFSGSFVYDQNTQRVESGSITDSSGPALSNTGFFKLTLPPASYDGAETIPPQPGCRSNCEWFGLEFYTAGKSFSSPYLDLFFYGDPATFTGGSIASSINYSEFFGGRDTAQSQEVFSEGLDRSVIRGAVTDTPEPGSMLLLFAGLGCLAFAYNRKVKQGVTR